MSTSLGSAPPPDRPRESFQRGYVLTFTFAHGVHDTYSSFLAPLLPALISKMSLSMTEAGLLDLARTIPSLSQPLLGHVGDRVNLRYLIVLAPAIAGTMMSLLGVAPSYGVLVVLALAAGFASAALHAVAPAMAGRFAGRSLGWGMGLWMVGGSIGFALGPMIIVAAVSQIGLEGTPWLMIGGWLASGILFLRLRGVTTLSPATEQPGSLREGLRTLSPIVAPVVGITAVRALMASAQITFLPTLLIQEGEGLWFAGISLTVQTAVGWIGALSGGAMSDRFGRRTVLFGAMSCAALLMLLFLAVNGWVRLPLLLLMGVTGPPVHTVLMAVVQENCPDNRAMATGTYLAVSFISSSLAAVAMGALGDLVGLRLAFILSAVILLAGAPLVRLLPEPESTVPVEPLE